MRSRKPRRSITLRSSPQSPAPPAHPPGSRPVRVRIQDAQALGYYSDYCECPICFVRRLPFIFTGLPPHIVFVCLRANEKLSTSRDGPTRDVIQGDRLPAICGNQLCVFFMKDGTARSFMLNKWGYRPITWDYLLYLARRYSNPYKHLTEVSLNTLSQDNFQAHLRTFNQPIPKKIPLR